MPPARLTTDKRTTQALQLRNLPLTETADVHKVFSDTETFARLVEAKTLPMDGVCLFLTDLGYFKVATFGNLRRRPDCHFLSKLQFGVRLANPDGTDLDLQGLLRKADAPGHSIVPL